MQIYGAKIEITLDFYILLSANNDKSLKSPAEIIILCSTMNSLLPLLLTVTVYSLSATVWIWKSWSTWTRCLVLLLCVLQCLHIRSNSSEVWQTIPLKYMFLKVLSNCLNEVKQLLLMCTGATTSDLYSSYLTALLDLSSINPYFIDF